MRDDPEAVRRGFDPAVVIEEGIVIACAYCERPLICDACQVPYLPPTPEHYEALTHSDVAIGCPECGAVLVCHWCKTPYDGVNEHDQADHAGDL
jgi:hypothetical protein